MRRIFQRFLTAFAVLAVSVSVLWAEEDANRYLVPGAQTYAGVEVSRVLTSPFGKFLLGQVSPKQKARIDKFTGQTGFNPLESLRRVLIASKSESGGAAGAATDAAKALESGLVVLEGDFEVASILGEAAAKGRQTLDYQGVPVIAGSEGVGEKGWMALPSNGIVLLGDPDWVKASLDGREQPSALDPETVRLLQEAPGKFDIWGISKTPISELSKNVESGSIGGALNGEAFKGIQEVMGGVRLENDIEIEGHFTTRSETDAEALANVVRFFTSLMAMQAADPKAPPVGAWLNTLSLQTQGPILSMALTIPRQDFEKLLQFGRLKAGVKPAVAGTKSAQPR